MCARSPHSALTDSLSAADDTVGCGISSQNASMRRRRTHLWSELRPQSDLNRIGNAVAPSQATLQRPTNKCVTLHGHRHAHTHTGAHRTRAVKVAHSFCSRAMTLLSNLMTSTLVSVPLPGFSPKCALTFAVCTATAQPRRRVRSRARTHMAWETNENMRAHMHVAIAPRQKEAALDAHTYKLRSVQHALDNARHKGRAIQAQLFWHRNKATNKTIVLHNHICSAVTRHQQKCV